MVCVYGCHDHEKKGAIAMGILILNYVSSVLGAVSKESVSPSFVCE